MRAEGAAKILIKGRIIVPLKFSWEKYSYHLKNNYIPPGHAQVVNYFPHQIYSQSIAILCNIWLLCSAGVRPVPRALGQSHMVAVVA